MLGSAGLSTPLEAPRGKRHRQPPDLDDWIALIEDYAMRCLAADPSPAAAARYDAIAAALRDFGFTLTRRGVRRGAGDVDRVLTSSTAKTHALVELLGCELSARGDGLRAVALADAELAATRADSALHGVLEREAGTAIAALRAVAGVDATAALRPLLVSGRGLRCAEHDADALTAALAARAEADGLALRGWEWALDADGLAVIAAAGPAWSSRTWVAVAGAILTAGTTRALVGTRALLGEGWDAPCVNCLVDLTVTTTSVTVRQIRGRSLRLDPADPHKLASNWDVICIASGLARGGADYRRFVRKHAHLHAPTETGEIEAGPSHVHPELSPVGPPPAGRHAQINADMRARAQARAAARERWRVGEPYLGEEHRTLLLRRRDGRSALPGGPGAAARGSRHAAAARRRRCRRAGVRGACRRGRSARRPRGARRRAGRAGRRRRAGRPGRRAVPRRSPRRAGGACDRRRLRAGGYWISRRVAVPRALARPRWRQALAGRPQLDELWTGVPHDLGRRVERRAAYETAWTRWLGPASIRRDEEGLVLAAEDAGYDTRLRDLWV